MSEIARCASSPAAVRVRAHRAAPLLLAGVICATASVLLGCGAWLLVGDDAQSQSTPAIAAPERAVEANIPVVSPAALQQVIEATIGAPPKNDPSAGMREVTVEGGVVELGGESKAHGPARRVAVGTFSISETEVTNAQYLEFVKAAQHPAPAHWHEQSRVVPEEPVTGVTWQDATAYCRWLSARNNSEVRLPTEAEWLRAAAGPQKLKYPWGNDWDERAAAREIKGGAPHAVKHFPLNKSFYGAYDMAGNVWEWVASEGVDRAVDNPTAPARPLQVIKGGALDESAEMIGVAARAEVPIDSADRLLGFRYVILRREQSGHEAQAARR